MYKEETLKEINLNYGPSEINTLVELDKKLSFITKIGQQNKQLDTVVNSIKISEILESVLKQVNNRLVIKKRQYITPFFPNNKSTQTVSEEFNIELINVNGETEHRLDITIIIDPANDIKTAYLQTEQRFLFYFFFGASNSKPGLEKIDNLGTVAVRHLIMPQNFMWIYKNMLVRFTNNSMPDNLSLQIALNFQKEIEKQVEQQHSLSK